MSPTYDRTASRGWPVIAAAWLATALFAPHSAAAQMRVITNDQWCDDGGKHGDGERHCEVREMTLGATGGRIEVDARPNGGVQVEGADRQDILVRARVTARAETEARARELASRVEVEVDGQSIHATGPRNDGDHEWWSVSYRLTVPRASDLDLRSTNGGIGIEGVNGDISFRTTNGGVSLADLGGAVQGATTNGGLDIRLSGDGWQGEGLDVRTTNGGIDMTIPADYSARLETGTTNGGLEIDFPITLQGRVDRSRLTTDLGSGGQTIRAVTTNGGVEIRRS